MPGVSALRADGPLGVGTRLHFTARGRERSSDVTQVSPGEGLTLTSHVGPVSAHYRYVLTPQADPSMTRLDLMADVEAAGLMKLLAPVIRKAIAREDSVQPANFKKMAEVPA